MIQSLQRKLKKIDKDLGISHFEFHARLLCQKLHWNVESAMPVVLRHHRELARHIGHGKWPGTTGPEGYQLIHKLVPRAFRHAPPPPPDAAGADPVPESDRKQRAIQALIDHPNNQYKAAEVAGISRVTLWRWMQQPSFLQALAAAKRRAYYHAFGALQRPSTEAAEVLLKIVGDATVPSRVRMRAALSVVSLGETTLDQVTLEADIAKMEEALNLGENPPAPPPCNTESPPPPPGEPATPSPSAGSPAPSAPGDTSPSVAKCSTPPPPEDNNT